MLTRNKVRPEVLVRIIEKRNFSVKALAMLSAICFVSIANNRAKKLEPGHKF